MVDWQELSVGEEPLLAPSSRASLSARLEHLDATLRGAPGNAELVLRECER